MHTIAIGMKYFTNEYYHFLRTIIASLLIVN